LGRINPAATLMECNRSVPPLLKARGSSLQARAKIFNSNDVSNRQVQAYLCL
jgi:hypothetical protein